MLRVTTLRIGSCRAPAVAAGLPDRGKVMLPALATLIETNTQTLLFDCGYGASFYDATDRFPARAYRIATPMTLPPQERLTAQLNRPPDLVILSHMHGDHVAGLLDLPDDIPVLASKEAIDHLSGLSSALTATLAACPPLLRDGVLARAPRPIDERQQVETGLPEFPRGHDVLGTGEAIAIALPGHGVGQIGLWLPDARHFLIADAAYARSALRDGKLPPWPVLARLGNARAYRQTFARLRTLMRARPDITLVPSHCREAAP